MSPKTKRELARQHLESARQDIDEERHADALNALFYAAEAATVWLADLNGIATNQKHWLKADAVATLHERGVVRADHSEMMRRLNQSRKDYWYDGEDVDPQDVEDVFFDVEALVEDAEAQR